MSTLRDTVSTLADAASRDRPRNNRLKVNRRLSSSRAWQHAVDHPNNGRGRRSSPLPRRARRATFLSRQRAGAALPCVSYTEQDGQAPRGHRT
eukprot:8035573-Pyramimonas_sp.AAC.1